MAWLFDLCPPDFRGYELLRRQPVVLARLAGDQVTGAIAACRHGLSTARADLRGLVDPAAIEETIALYEREVARLGAVERSLRLVEAALQGRRFVPRL